MDKVGLLAQNTSACVATSPYEKKSLSLRESAGGTELRNRSKPKQLADFTPHHSCGVHTGEARYSDPHIKTQHGKRGVNGKRA